MPNSNEEKQAEKENKNNSRGNKEGSGSYAPSKEALDVLNSMGYYPNE